MGGSYKAGSELKKGYHLMRASMTNADLARIINSEEIQSVVTTAKEGPKTASKQKRNPLKNREAMAKLNPGINARKKLRELAEKEGTKQRQQVVAKKRATAAAAKAHHGASKEFYNKMMAAYAVEEKKEDAEDELATERTGESSRFQHCDVLAYNVRTRWA